MSDIEGKSYRYLRMTIVILLLGLAASVVYQIIVDDFMILGSVSAYYHTKAQAIFVSALIATGACMIALKGTNEVEDVFLNLGGVNVLVTDPRDMPGFVKLLKRTPFTAITGVNTLFNALLNAHGLDNVEF